MITIRHICRWGLIGIIGVIVMPTIAPVAIAQTSSSPVSNTTIKTDGVIHGDDNQSNDDKLNVASKSTIKFAPLFVQLSDAMARSKADDGVASVRLLQGIKMDLLEQQGYHKSNDPVFSAVIIALDEAISTPTQANLSAVSKQLYQLEQQQNPTDYNAQRQKFAQKVMPAFERLKIAFDAVQARNRQATTNQTGDDLAQLRQAYAKFNAIWSANERVVRATSMGHYGAIETAMALMRVAMEQSPANIEQIQAQMVALEQSLTGFVMGEQVLLQTQQVTLSDGIELLEQGLLAFSANDVGTAQTKLGRFIAIWSGIEGDVSTRNKALYQIIESQLPVIMAAGQDVAKQEQLRNIIRDLKAINVVADYTAFDAMAILLREGFEALLIIMALLSALTAAGQSKGKYFVYAGVVAGLLASIFGALALQRFLPALTAGVSREFLEGVVGIVAVVMMMGVGAWLHSKSSVRAWNAFVKKHMGQVLTGGSLAGLFGLSFLSVFREGAETILFYVGILPNITMTNFVLGIVLALVILSVVAVILLKTSLKLPMAFLFKWLTFLIYFLGFKILGVSIAALQLTQHLSRTPMNIQPLPWLGFYPSIEGFLVQLLYVLLVIMVLFYNTWRLGNKHHIDKQTTK